MPLKKNTDLTSPDSATTGFVTLADGTTLNVGAVLAAIALPTKAYSLDSHFSDTVVLPTPVRSFRVGTTAGDVTLRYSGDAADVTIPNVQVGEHIQGNVVAVRVTGTSAVGLTGWV